MRRIVNVSLRSPAVLGGVGLFGAFRDLSGKVRAWKHYSGYGFVAGDDGVDYYTHRAELGGGFYLTEGQAVEFDAQKDDPTKNPRAVKMRNPDGTPITPVEIRGVIARIDAARGGTIAELDVRGQRHPDSPMFLFTPEQIEFNGRLYVNDVVRFAIDPASQLPVKIIPRGTKKQQELPRSGASFAARPPGEAGGEETAGAAAADASAAMDTGTIRDLRDSFGFISCHSNNESVFFHKNDIVGPPLTVGDLVTFIKGVDTGRNQGKSRGTKVTKVESK